MKKSINITIKEYDQNYNLSQISDINIECGKPIKHLEDGKTGIIDTIRENFISILWSDNSRENFNFYELNKLEYLNSNGLPLINIQKINIQKINIPLNNNKEQNYKEKVYSDIISKFKCNYELNSKDENIIKNILNKTKNKFSGLNSESQNLLNKLEGFNWTINSELFEEK